MSDFKVHEAGRAAYGIVKALRPSMTQTEGDYEYAFCAGHDHATRAAASEIAVAKAAASAISRIYFEIAAEAIGEEEVRRRRDERIAAEIANGTAATATAPVAPLCPVHAGLYLTRRTNYPFCAQCEITRLREWLEGIRDFTERTMPHASGQGHLALMSLQSAATKALNGEAESDYQYRTKKEG